MKKLTSLVLALVFITCLFAGCANNASSAPQSASAAPASSAAAEGSDAGSAAGATDLSSIKIGWAVKTQNEERWVNEVKYMEQFAKDAGVELIVQSGNNDAQLQISQIENMMTQGIDVLIWNSIDPSAMAATIQKARDAGIKIVSYDENIENLEMDAFVGYSHYDIGVMITTPLKDLDISGNVAFIGGDISAGDSVNKFMAGMKDGMEGLDYENVFEQYCVNWEASAAQGYAENVLSMYGEDIVAFACMNDGMASGVVQALEAAGLAGKVYVTGQDAELTALQRIVEGTQTSTVMKGGPAMAQATLDASIALALGEELDTGEIFDNGYSIPWVKVDAYIVTADNMQETIIDTGLYTYEDIYGTAAA